MGYSQKPRTKLFGRAKIGSVLNRRLPRKTAAKGGSATGFAGRCRRLSFDRMSSSSETQNDIPRIRKGQAIVALSVRASLAAPHPGAASLGGVAKLRGSALALGGLARSAVKRPESTLSGSSSRTIERRGPTYCGHSRRGLWTGAVGREADLYAPDFRTA